MTTTPVTESLLSNRSLIRWSATTASGDPLAGLAMAADFHEASRAAIAAGADRARLVHVRPASQAERFAWSRADDHSADRIAPYVDADFDDEGFVLRCTHCNGEGDCDANANPLWDCDDNPHPCHACGGSGERRDQRIF